DKAAFHDRFIRVVAGEEPAQQLAATLPPRLSAATPAAERDLIRNMGHVVALTHDFNDRQLAAIARCIRIMCHGMSAFQQRLESAGLTSLAQLDQYCYYVAGVVGEMVIDLFCDHAPEINLHRGEVMAPAQSFGNDLQ